MMKKKREIIVLKRELGESKTDYKKRLDEARGSGSEIREVCSFCSNPSFCRMKKCNVCGEHLQFIGEFFDAHKELLPYDTTDSFAEDKFWLGV